MFNAKALKNTYFIFKGSDNICFIADAERTQRILNGDEYIDWEEYSVFDPSTGTWRFFGNDENENTLLSYQIDKLN